MLTLTAAGVLLAWWLATRGRVVLTARGAVLGLLGSSLVVATVPLFSYLPAATRWWARGLLAGAAVVAAGLLYAARPRGRAEAPAGRVPAGSTQAEDLRQRRLLAAVWVVVIGAYAVATIIAVRSDPAPRIDVWVTLQQASDAMLRGENFYNVHWVNSPGMQDAFTYLPWTAVLLAPGRWLAGDIRWMQLLWVGVLALGIWQLGRTRVIAGGGTTTSPHAAVAAWTAAAVTALLLLAPGTLTQIDQAWTEPLLLTGIVWWAVLVLRGYPWWAVLPLAVACASKQHLALVLPLLLVWNPFGWRRAVTTGAVAAALIAPWFLASPSDFVHDTISVLLHFHPIKFANTWYLLALNVYDVTLPFWVTGLAVLGSLAVAIALVLRRQPSLGEVLRWAALVLLAANLVNKQAFYNQFWLVGGLVAVSLVADLAPARLTPPPRADAAGAAAPGRRRLQRS